MKNNKMKTVVSINWKVRDLIREKAIIRKMAQRPFLDRSRFQKGFERNQSYRGNEKRINSGG